MRIPRGFIVLLVFAITLPALYTLVHGEVDVKDNVVPTPDKELRSNERVGSKTDDEVVQREEEAINPEGFSVKEMKQLRELGQSHQFQAEVNKLMNIIINSLYSNKDVFLRELISNASDALDKIRFLSLTDPKQLDSNSKFEIRIKADRTNNLLHITDSGVGMTKQELTNNLGTIAKSGTTEFLEKFKETAAGDTSLIGQFGVGFYSVFLIADTVTVTSKHNDDKQHVWISDAQGSYSVVEDPRGNTLGRGTQISIAVKEDATEYLEEARLKQLVKKYSEFINFPIYLYTEIEEDKVVPLTEEELAEQAKKREEEKAAKAAEEAEEEVQLEETEEKEEEEEVEEELPTTKTIKITTNKWELMNETKPLWTRNPKDVTEEEYNAFYKALVKSDANPPSTHIHFTAEGEVDFKALLYIPGNRPTNIYDPQIQEELAKGIKLYVRRVFITDEFKDLLPRYLNFVKGIVDSDDLPLNVSREMLQEHKTLKIIKKKLIRKAIAMFQEMAEDEDNKDKYKNFWKNFGENIKLGLIEDPNNRLRLSKLLMFQSSKTEDLSSLSEYVERMKKGQEQIYYLGGENLEAVQSSPLIEKLVKKGYEVLFMVDPIDEYALQHLDKFDGKYKMVNIAREGLKLDGDDLTKTEEGKFATLISYLKETLGTKIEKAAVSSRLTSSPSALVSGSFGWTANMERIVKAQTMGDNSNNKMYAPRKTLEINPKHPIVIELQNRVEKDKEDPVAKDIARLMYDTAALSSGFSLDDQADFAQRIVRLMNKNLNLDPNAAPEDEPEETEEAPAPEEVVEEVEEVNGDAKEPVENKDEL